MTMALPKIQLTVKLADVEEPLDVVAINPDLIRYESEARKRGLPSSAEDAPVTWQTFLAWAALTREKRYAGEWQKFKLEDCLMVAMTEDEAVTDPTQTADEYSSA